MRITSFRWRKQPPLWAALVGKVGLTFTRVEGGEDSVWKECEVCVPMCVRGLWAHAPLWL